MKKNKMKKNEKNGWAGGEGRIPPMKNFKTGCIKISPWVVLLFSLLLVLDWY